MPGVMAIPRPIRPAVPQHPAPQLRSQGAYLNTCKVCAAKPGENCRAETGEFIQSVHGQRVSGDGATSTVPRGL